MWYAWGRAFALRVKRTNVAVALVVIAGVAAAAGWRAWRDAPPDSGPRGHVAVAAAADLRFALDDLRQQFEQQRPDVRVEVTYGSSGTFYAQLVNGAPFDMFLSADEAYPRRLADQGLTMPGGEFTYGVGRLVLWVPAGSPIDVEHAGFDALDDGRVAHVAVANPDHAPYGRAAIASLEAAERLNRVKPKLVYGENIAQTLQFVQSGAADAGIVALSLALAPTVSETGRFWQVPLDLYPPMAQGGTIMKKSADPAAAKDLRAFLLSAAGQATLKRYGFFLPG